MNAELGNSLHSLIRTLYPLCRSITGDAVRRTLTILQQRIPLAIHEVPTGTPVFDWTIPNEWNNREAYIANSKGQRIIDLKGHSLHIVSFSTPIRATMRLADLRPHLHSLPDRPDVIPYRTSYYAPNWGFCLTHRQLESLPDEEYEVVIDSTLAPGHLTYGEFLIPGQTQDEILLSAHICHPSLANDNLSGISLLTHLAESLQSRQSRYSVRVLLIPGTIGSIAWLARNEANVGRIKHGLIVSCAGDPAPFTYKKSRRGDAAIDRAASHVLRDRPHTLMDFSPYGYDERQFSSPGFNLPVGLLMRSCYGQFQEYHTSADNLDFVTPAALAGSYQVLSEIIDALQETDPDAPAAPAKPSPPARDRDATFINTNPKCEPQLGRRGLYSAVGGHASPKQFELAMLWVLNQSDGSMSLLDIARKASLPFEIIADAADALCNAGLLRENPSP